MFSLEIDSVKCRYESIEVLDGLSFSVGSNEFMGVLGPNGSGKTTLLRTISRTLKPHTGVILLDGQDIYQMTSKAVAKQVAVVPQDSVIAFSFTALDVVLMGRSPHLSRFQMEDPKDLAIAEEAMKLVDVWHLADRPITEVSGGERQRIVIARALTQKPRVLLLDEPTLHLDVGSQIEIMDLTKNLCKQNKLITISVFHDFNLAARYSDRLILLHDKRIVSIGKPEDVLTRKNIAGVFGVEAFVKKHPITNSLYVIPLSISGLESTPAEAKKKKFRVHVICGGGSGSLLMANLVKQGLNVTAGVLNLLDTDHDAAQALSIPIASEAPFSPITEEAYTENLRFIQQARVVIVTDFLIGHGNLRNLEAVKVALEKKIPTVILNNLPIEKRDFTNGEAERCFKELIAAGVHVVETHDQALRIIERVQNERLREGVEESEGRRLVERG